MRSPEPEELPVNVDRIQRRLRDERGLTLLEFVIALTGLLLLSAVMVTLFVGVTRMDDLHREDDDVVQQLRIAKELLTKDLRRAEHLIVADAKTVTIWIDEDHDGLLDAGEQVTWAIGSDGSLTRSDTAGASVVHVDSLAFADSSFSFDAADAVDVRRVAISLAADVDAISGPGTRYIATEVSLRNAR